jgi:CNT family concentrative nucleoside transporter
VQILVSLLGFVILLVAAYLLSASRSNIRPRTVLCAFGLQLFVGFFALYLPIGKTVLGFLTQGMSQVLSYGSAGIEFLFGDLGRQQLGFIFAVNVLPVVIFFSALVSVLYYLGIMGWVIKILGGAIQKLLGTSKAESMSATANIFVSQTEAPVVVKPFVPKMTESEIFAVMVGGMATVSGSVLAGYVGLGVELKYLLAASFMAAPGGLLMAKMLVPESNQADSGQAIIFSNRGDYANILDAAAGGAATGLKLAVNIGAMLLAFIALIAMLNGILSGVGSWFGFEQLSMQYLFGIVFKPIAFLVGVPWSEAGMVGSLIGQKLVLNEFVAFADFYQNKGELSAHSQAVATFALCGFANFSSIAIQLGGLSLLAPQRRADIARLGMRAVIAAFLANLMSAAIASLFLSLG